jgi:hypothetical protein
MRADRDPDLLLVERMLAPPPLDEARSSLEYWQRRQRNLPFHRRAARREAREMAARCEERVRAAEQARFEATPFGRLLTALGISSLWLRRVRSAETVLSWLAWAFVLRRMKLVAGGLVAVGLILVVGAVAALVVVFDQFA